MSGPTFSDGDLPRGEPGDAPTRWFRPDVDGLRAVAIVVIVAFHAGVPGFRGGFIGVDVFFVISGYLITAGLLRERERHGTVRLLSFWAKRIRRLVPAMTLMVATTMLASVVILSSLLWDTVAKEGLAAAFYVANIFFARQSEDYFAANVNESPFLHTWSLGVEEQFYLVWPILVVGVAIVIVRSRPRLLRPALIGAFSAVLASSFALNLTWTESNSAWAFYSLPTRAWEFAAAGLLAAVSIEPPWRRRSIRIATALLGLGLLVYALERINSQTPYPGTAALLPVVGTLLLIYSGQGGDGSPSPHVVTRALAARPTQWVGRLSYSWYLWHWPFIILIVAATGDDTAPVRTTAVAASLPVAYMAYRFVENPLRYSPRLMASTGATYAMGGVALLVAVAGFGLVQLDSTEPPAASVEAMVKTMREETAWPCAGRTTPAGVKYCVAGDVNSETIVVVVGDSHALAWTAALSDAATEVGVQLAMITKPGCPTIPVRIRPEPTTKGTYADCEAFRAEQAAILDELDPTALVLVEAEVYLGSIETEDGRIPGEAAQVDLWSDAFESYLTMIDDRGIKPAVVLDNPNLPASPTKCILREQSIEACVPTRHEALASILPLQSAQTEILEAIGDVPAFAPVEVLCNDTVCPLEVDGHLVYLDDDHLSNYITRTMVPQLAELLAQATTPAN